MTVVSAYKYHLRHVKHQPKHKELYNCTFPKVFRNKQLLKSQQLSSVQLGKECKMTARFIPWTISIIHPNAAWVPSVPMYGKGRNMSPWKCSSLVSNISLDTHRSPRYLAPNPHNVNTHDNERSLIHTRGVTFINIPSMQFE